MEAGTLFFCATADAITLYWDKPAGAAAPCCYEVRLAGSALAETPHTHYTLDGLMPDTAYTLEVRLDGKSLGGCRAATTPQRRRLDVRRYGAVGDGKAMETSALQAALDACRSGEEVYLPAGVYRTGALRLHSNMALHLAEGAVLQGSSNPEDYTPRIWSRFEGIEQECYQSLLNLGTLDHTAGPNCRNVLIYGKGTISGGGRELALAMIESERRRLRQYLADHAELVKTCENEDTIPGRVRGRLINMSNCENIRITGLTLENGPSWNIHMIYSRHIITDHCQIRSESVWNGDGWDPDSSEWCTLFACRFATGDDMVAIKSGKNPEGNRINRPSRHIRVFDCSSKLGHGIAIGSEMSGGVEDVRIWDCDISHSSNGLEIKGTPQRGGYVRGVTVQDCRFPRLLIHAVPYNNDGVPAPQPPQFSGFTFIGLTLTGRRLEQGQWETVIPLEVAGFEQPGYEVRDLRILGCRLAGPVNQLRLEHCAGVTFKDLCCDEEI